MANDLNIYGDNYLNVTGFRVKDTNGNTVTYTAEKDEAPDNDVILIDYDGTRVYSYSKEEFLALTEMPPNPAHKGLIGDGWNWTLAQAKEYVQKYTILIIGAHYITDDGKTRFYITKSSDTDLESWITFGSGTTGTVDIDWGDGFIQTAAINKTQTTVKHTYASIGSYAISIEPSGTMAFSILNSTPSTGVYYPPYDLEKIEIGSNVSGCANGWIRQNYNLMTVTVPSYFAVIGNEMNDHHIRCMVSPKNRIDGYTGNTADGYKYLSFGYIEPGTVNGDNVFINTSYVTKISIPEVIKIGGNAIRYAYGLVEFHVPETVTTIHQNVFSNCTRLKKLYLHPTSVITRGAASGFTNLPADCVFYVPYTSDHSLINAYKEDTNWVTWADRFQEMEPEE